MSTLAALLGPRQAASAARIASWITVICAVVSAVFAAAAPPAHLPLALNWLAPALLLAVTGVLRRAGPAPATWLCLAVPLVGTGLITALDLCTHDGSLSGQIFFLLPVLYAGSQLRPVGIAVVTACTLGGMVAVSLGEEALHVGVADAAYLGTTLVLTAVVLGHSGRRDERLTEALRRQAAIDPLTGLVTRRVLDEAARSAISEGLATMGTALILVDVDRFKAVNDTYGHPAGDAALAHVASVLTQLSRREDLVARMGGDELAVLLPGCPLAVASERADAYVTAVRDTPLYLPATDQIVGLSVSAGVAHAPSHSSAVQTLYAAADLALYSAKRAGRGRAETATGLAG